METQGIVDWVTKFGASGETYGISLKVSSNGYIYITGSFSGPSVKFYSTNDKTSIVVNVDKQFTSGVNGFLAKYNESGIVQWATGFYSNGSEEDRNKGYGLAVTDKNIYITGAFGGSQATFYSTDGSTKSINGKENADTGFVAKYNDIGIVEWAAAFSSSRRDTGYDIAVGRTGEVYDIYITGEFGGSQATFYSTDGSTESINGKENRNSGFVAKYNDIGIVQWAIPFYGNSTKISNAGYGIAINNTGELYNIYITGAFGGSQATFYSTDESTKIINVDGISEYGFVAKYDINGVVEWAAPFYNSEVSYCAGVSITTSNTGYVYITGFFQGTQLTFYSADDKTKKTINGGGQSKDFSNGFIVKYNESGIAQWATVFYGNAGAVNLRGNYITVTKTDYIYITGGFSGTQGTFYSTDGTKKTINGSGKTESGLDGFVAKYNQAGIAQWATPFYSNTNGKDDEGSNIAVSTNGDIYITGAFNSTTTFYSMNGKNKQLTADGDNVNGFIAKYSDVDVEPICFVKGSLVSTDQGPVEIQTIDPSVHTIGGKRIVTVTKSISPRDILVCFERGALGPNMPMTRTVMTDTHKVLHKRKMYNAIELVNGKTVYKVKNTRDPLYNVLMEGYEVMRVNNLTVETLHPEHYIAQRYNNTNQ